MTSLESIKRIHCYKIDLCLGCPFKNGDPHGRKHNNDFCFQGKTRRYHAIRDVNLLNGNKSTNEVKP